MPQRYSIDRHRQTLEHFQEQQQQAIANTYGYPVESPQQLSGEVGEGAENSPVAGGNETLGEPGIKALQSEREARKRAEARAKELEEKARLLEGKLSEVSPEEYQRLKAEAEAANQLRDQQSRMKAQLEAEAEAKINALELKRQDEVQRLKQHTERTIREALLRDAYNKSGANPKQVEAFLRGWGDARFQLVYPENEMPSFSNAKLIPLDEDGSVWYGSTNASETPAPIPPDEAIKKSAEKGGDFAVFFPAKSGTGSTGYIDSKGKRVFMEPPKNASSAWARLS